MPVKIDHGTSLYVLERSVAVGMELDHTDDEHTSVMRTSPALSPTALQLHPDLVQRERSATLPCKARSHKLKLNHRSKVRLDCLTIIASATPHLVCRTMLTYCQVYAAFKFVSIMKPFRAYCGSCSSFGKSITLYHPNGVRRRHKRMFFATDATCL